MYFVGLTSKLLEAFVIAQKMGCVPIYYSRVGEIDEENFVSLRKLFSQDIKKEIYEVAEFTNAEKLESTKLLLKYAKKHSLKTLDAMQLSVVKSVNQPELKAVVCADEKFCKIIALEGFPVINPIIGDNS